ncbi:MAG: hypothetical protein AB1938_10945, partial [Myxococcota bacterium]
MKNLSVLSAALVTVCASPALAERISFTDFSGPGAAGVRNQLVTAVCDTADCIAPSKTTTRGKPDWKKAKKAQVQFIITGAVAKKARSVELQIFDKQGAPRARKSWPLEKNGTLSAKNLQAAIDLMRSTFGTSEVTPAPPPPPPPPPHPPTTRPPP